MYYIYKQDNLELMKSLPDNHINLIYCDILYGTGRNFGDYQDLKADRKIIEEHYISRITEMKRVLKDDGNIYIHCDNKIVHWIRCIMDDIFGYDRFINEIIWWYNSAPRKKGHFASRHDNILRYSKTKNFYFDEECEEIRVEYSPSAPRGYEKEHYYNPKGKIMDDVWRLWMIGQNDKTERVGYLTQKPKKVIKPIILSSCPKDGLVADFYMGSGTTGEVALENGRNFIGCDIGEKAFDVTSKRLEKYDKTSLL